MKKFTRLLATVIMVLVTKISLAQNTASVKGIVADENKSPLVAATVSLFDGHDSSLIRTAVTQENGKYEFQNVPDGIYFATYSNVGYKTKSGNSFILNQSLKYCCDTVILFAEKNQLKEVVISGKKQFIEAKEDKLVINIENSATSAGTTVMEVLQKTPGVMVDKDGNIMMQGKTGVQVMIDGRPTYLSKSDLANMLRSMPANQVQNIELISNPSAKYDASGTAGIINIKTKKNTAFGTNGSINAGAGYGENAKANAGINLNYRNKNINVFGNYNYTYDRIGKDLLIDRVATQNNTHIHFNQDGTEDYKKNNHGIKVGADYTINSKNSIGVLFNGFDNSEKEKGFNTTTMGNQKGTKDSSLIANNNSTQHIKNYSYNLNYQSKLGKGKELSANADYANYQGGRDAFYRNDFYDAVGVESKVPLFIRNNTNSDIEIKSAKIDFSSPLKKDLKLESGLKASWIKTDNEIQFDEKISNEWVKDINKSNRFIYDENVMAAYISASDKWKNTTVQAGVRAEYSETKGNSITTNKIVTRSYLDFFPSLFINHQINADNSLGLSYSRRIQRPNYESLNPFTYFIDQYAYMVGNPFLNPQYTNSYQITYMYKRKYLVQGAYSGTNDAITEIILTDTARKAIYQTSENLEKQNSYRITVSAPVQITKWWLSNNNISGMEMDYKSNNLKGQDFKAAHFFAIINTNQSYNIGNGFTGELNGKFTSPMIYGTLKIRWDYSIDAGISKSLFNKKGNVKFAVNDIFNTSKQNITSAYPGVDYSLKQKWETRIFRLSFSYRFGNSNVKTSRSKTSSLEDEQSRLKS